MSRMVLDGPNSNPLRVGRLHVAVSDADQGRICRLLLQDIEATIGPGYEAVVSENAINVRTFVDSPAAYREKLVEDVQQYFHDCFVDTTWPTCPRHAQHPLWLRGEHWYCERDGEPIARLGELRSLDNRGTVS